MKKENYGISLLRIWACIFVVCTHYHRNWEVWPDNYTYFWFLTVPVYFLISFYFGEKMFFEPDFDKKKNRLKRLLFPYLFWCVVSWLVADRTLKGLALQIFTGTVERINPVFWFLCDIMVMTLLLMILAALFKYKKLPVLIILSVISVLFVISEYEGTLYRLMENMPYEVINSYGRIIEMTPFMTEGLLLKELKIPEKLEKKRWVALPVLLVSFIIILLFRKTILPTAGYTYAFSGLSFIILAPVTFLFFWLLPFDGLNEKVKKVIKFFSTYVMSAYALHWIVGKLFPFNSLIWCICLAALCMLFGALLCKIPGKPGEFFKKVCC